MVNILVDYTNITTLGEVPVIKGERIRIQNIFAKIEKYPEIIDLQINRSTRKKKQRPTVI